MQADLDDGLDGIVDGILASYRRHGDMNCRGVDALPSRDAIGRLVDDLLALLFPRSPEPGSAGEAEFTGRAAAHIRSVSRRLRAQVEKGLRFRPGTADGVDRRAVAAEVTRALLRDIPDIRALLAADIEAAYDGDPAAQSLEEIVLAYPGLRAIAVYRLAHVLYRQDVPIVPRVMSEYAHTLTGIDIHPGARIGRRFFIDHGTGVVIGETSTIGDDVKIYQGVTLGARSFPQDERGRAIKGTKRHPDIEDRVTIYSGATILGPVRIGRGSIVGGNVWLTHGVPPDTRIVVRTPQQVHIEQNVDDYQI